MMEEAPNAEEAWNAYRKRIRTRSEKAREAFLAGFSAGCRRSAASLLELIRESKVGKGGTKKNERRSKGGTLWPKTLFPKGFTVKNRSQQAQCRGKRKTIFHFSKLVNLRKSTPMKD